MPALPPYLNFEPIWEQLRTFLLPERNTNHPLGCHRLRISERVVFEKLVQVRASAGVRLRLWQNRR